MEQHFIIDCNYIAHKARFTVGELSYRGVPTGVLYGFLSQILNIAESFSSPNFIFCWDSKKSYRKQTFPAYKKKRHQDLTEKEKIALYAAYDQMELLAGELLDEIGFKNNFQQTGVEGDDIMAKIVLDPKYSRYFFTMLASDHDLYQLLSPRVNMMQTQQDRFVMYGEKNFMAEFGITPKQWIKVKQIAGCTTDEVPSCGRELNNPENIIARIGEKTACDHILGKLKPTTKAYQRIDSAEGREIIEFNELLVKLPHPRTKEITLQKDELNLSNFKAICKEFGFKEFLDERMDEWERLFNNDYEGERKS